MPSGGLGHRPGDVNRLPPQALARQLPQGAPEALPGGNLQKDNTREVKQSGTEIYLLYHANVPAVMVECGFLSNAEETAKLKDEGYQRELAFLTALGVVEYLSGR